MLYNNRLTELRESKNLKIQDISKILNFEKDTYGKYEREYVIIPTKHLNTLCNYFDVSIDYTLEFTNTKKYFSSNKNINPVLSGSRLKKFRHDNNLTQSKLAYILNTDNSTISKYEKGINIIALPFLYTICKEYKISADYLLGKTDTPIYFK